MGEDVELVCPYCFLIPQSFALEDDGSAQRFGIEQTDPCFEFLGATGR